MSTDVSLPELQEHRSNTVEDGSREDDELSLLDLLIVLAERKRRVLGSVAVVAILAAIVSFLLPVRYSATVSLLPPAQNSSIGSSIASQLGNFGGMAALAGGGLGLKNPNDQYVAMFRSRTVEDAMVQRFGLMQEYHSKRLSDARKEFEKIATVDAAGKDNLIHISIEDSNPKRAAELANGYVDQFQKLSEHLAITEASQRRLFFEQQLEQAKERLASAEEALKQTEQKTGLIQLDSQARALIESAASLRAQIAAKEVQIESIRTYATSENSQLVQAQRELEELQAQLAKLGGSENGGGDDLLMSRGRVPEAGLEYVRRLRDVKYYETIFDILARQFELAKLDEAKEGALIQVVDAAIPPDRRSFPKRGLIVIGAAIGGLILGICLALFTAGLEHLKSDPASNAKLRYLKRLLYWRHNSAS